MRRITIISLILLTTLLSSSKLVANETSAKEYGQSEHAHYTLSMDEGIPFMFSDFHNTIKTPVDNSYIHHFVGYSRVRKVFKAPHLKSQLFQTIASTDFESDIRKLTDNGPLSIELPHMTNDKRVGMMTFSKCIELYRGGKISCRNRMRKLEISIDRYENFKNISADEEPISIQMILVSDLYLNDPLVGVTNYIITDEQVLMTDELIIHDWCGTK